MRWPAVLLFGVVTLTACGGGHPAPARSAAASPATSTAPSFEAVPAPPIVPAGWSQVVYDIGDRTAGGSTRFVAGPGEQVVLELVAEGEDVEQAASCLVDVTDDAFDCVKNSAITATPGSPAHVYVDLVDGKTYTESVHFAGVGQWRVWIYAQPCDTASGRC